MAKNRYPIYDQNSRKTIPFGAAHTYIAHIRESPPGDFSILYNKATCIIKVVGLLELWNFCE